MAPKYQSPWQCSKHTCASTHNEYQTTPTVSLVSTFDRNCRTNIQIQNREYPALFDSGSSISCISSHVVNKLYKNTEFEASKITHVKGVCGEIHPVLGTITFAFLLDGYPFSEEFHVFSTLHESVIIGREFMHREHMRLDFDSNSVSMTKPDSEPISIAFLTSDLSKTDFGKTSQTHIVPPHSEYLLSLKTNKFKDGEEVLCEPPKHLAKDELAGGKCLSTVRDGHVQYRLMNPTALPVYRLRRPEQSFHPAEGPCPARRRTRPRDRSRGLRHRRTTDRESRRSDSGPPRRMQSSCPRRHSRPPQEWRHPVERQRPTPDRQHH